jgi:hypothetical protein
MSPQINILQHCPIDRRPFPPKQFAQKTDAPILELLPKMHKSQQKIMENAEKTNF